MIDISNNQAPSEVKIIVDGYETTLQEFLHVNTHPMVGESSIEDLVRILTLEPDEEVVLFDGFKIKRIR